MSDQTGPDSLPLVEQVGVVGGAVWVERRIFELEGRWSDDEADAELAVELATNSRYHGWHAELLADCLPDSPALDADAHIMAPTPGWASLFDGGLDEGSDWPDAGWARAVVLARVILPRTIAGYDALAAAASPVSDGPLQRALGHILDDQVAEWRLLERRAQQRVRTADDIDAAGRFVVGLDRLLAHRA